MHSSAKLSELEAVLSGQLLQAADNFTLISLDFSAHWSRPEQTSLIKGFLPKTNADWENNLCHVVRFISQLSHRRKAMLFVLCLHANSGRFLYFRQQF